MAFVRLSGRSLNSFAKVQLRDHSGARLSGGPELARTAASRGCACVFGSRGPLTLSPRMSLAGSGPPFVAGIQAGFWPPSSLAAAELSPRLYE